MGEYSNEALPREGPAGRAAGENNDNITNLFNVRLRRARIKWQYVFFLFVYMFIYREVEKERWVDIVTQFE